jgi:hypothetical protein
VKRPRLAGWLLALGLGAVDAAGHEIRLVAHESRAMRQTGATAAYAVDPDIVEVTIDDEHLLLVALRAGTTLVSVVRPRQVETFAVVVDPAPSRLPAALTRPTRDAAVLALRHDSGIDRTGMSASLRLGVPERGARVELHAMRGGPDSDSGRSIAMPSASIELHSGDRSVTLLDQYIEASPLTLDGTVVRGVHLRDATRELHVGVASIQPWGDLLLPEQGDRVASAAWRIDRGATSFVPSLLWLPDSGTRVPGAIALGVHRGTREDALQLAAEVGWSDEPGAAFDVSLRQPQRVAWLRGAYRPDGFAALDVSRPAGAHLDGAWTERLGTRTQVSVDASISRIDLGARDPRAQSARLQVRHQLTPAWNVDAGIGAGQYRETDTEPQRRATASLGAGYESDDFGASLQYRYQRVSGAEGGHGGRISLRAARSGLRANLHLDAQQNSPGLDLVLPPDSDIARAFADLGLVAGSPEDVVRLLRDHAAEFAHYDISVGALHFDRLRMRGGLDLAWQRADAARSRYGLRLLVDEARGLVDTRRTLLATVFASWRAFGDVDIELGVTRWSSDAGAASTQGRNSVQIGLRKHFDGFALPGTGRRAIRGWVLQDPRGTGVPAADADPVAGVEIVLDDERRVRTDVDGYFAFDAPGPGVHRIAATLPAGVDGYFTGNSTRTLRAGEEVRFGLLPAPARVAGRVRSDAGVPLAEVRVLLSGAIDATTTTDSEGVFRFASPPGDVVVTVSPESVPVGYELAALEPQPLRAGVGASASADFVLRAQRSVSGTVSGATEDTIVVASETGRTATPDARGRFVLRGLPCGDLTLVVKSARGESRHVVTLPATPGRIDELRLHAP